LNLSRQTLRSRHRLSHQQIDGLLGEKKSGNFTAEKLEQMQGLRFFHEFTSGPPLSWHLVHRAERPDSLLTGCTMIASAG